VVIGSELIFIRLVHVLQLQGKQTSFHI
jgi:hypothetical protein